MPEHILIVDDDALLCDLFKMMLNRVGYHTRSVVSGLKALDELEAGPTDLVLLDMMMAEVDGAEVLRRIRQNPRFADLPVIILTALVETQSRVQPLNLRVDSILFKPVEPDRLVKEVRRILEEAKSKAAVPPQVSSTPVQPPAPTPAPSAPIPVPVQAPASQPTPPQPVSSKPPEPAPVKPVDPPPAVSNKPPEPPKAV